MSVANRQLARRRRALTRRTCHRSNSTSPSEMAERLADAAGVRWSVGANRASSSAACSPQRQLAEILHDGPILTRVFIPGARGGNQCLGEVYLEGLEWTCRLPHSGTAEGTIGASVAPHPEAHDRCRARLALRSDAAWRSMQSVEPEDPSTSHGLRSVLLELQPPLAPPHVVLVRAEQAGALERHADLREGHREPDGLAQRALTEQMLDVCAVALEHFGAGHTGHWVSRNAEVVVSEDRDAPVTARDDWRGGRPEG